MQIDAAVDRRYTYWQLMEHVRNCATSLSQLGLGIGQRVCLLLPNCIEFPVAFLAILRLGAVCVPFNPAATKCTRLPLVLSLARNIADTDTFTQVVLINTDKVNSARNCFSLDNF